MILCQVATAGVSIFAVRSALRRAREAEAHAAKCESVSVEASAAVLAVADALEGRHVAAGDDDSQPAADLHPVVVGYGQTKSIGARYIYRDIRYPDGSVRREFVQRFPK